MEFFELWGFFVSRFNELLDLNDDVALLKLSVKCLLESI